MKIPARNQHEIGKMISNLVELGVDFRIVVERKNTYIQNEMYDDFYDGLRQEYLKAMGYEKTDLMEISPETYERLSQLADREGKSVDEVAIQILKEYMDTEK